MSYDSRSSKPPTDNNIPSGPYSQNFERYVGVLFRPATTTKFISRALHEYSGDELPPSVEQADLPASVLLRMQGAPLENMFSLYTKACGIEDDNVAQLPKFPVYQPKQSSEYHYILNQRPKFDKSGNVLAEQTSQINCWRPPSSSQEGKTFHLSPSNRQLLAPTNTKHLLIDYKDFDTTQQPLSEYLYQGYNYVRSTDSRIVGSNFVMLSLRGPDAWFNKVDRLLEEAKKC